MQQETIRKWRGRAGEFFAVSRVYNKMNLRGFTVLLSALAAGCATVEAFDEPYTLFEGGFRSAGRKEIPVIINTVDGQALQDPRRSVAIKPGRHQLDVRFTTATGPDRKHRATLEIVAEPCTRYRIVARYTNLTHVEWMPVIYPEPIGECVARFGQTTPHAV
jgi:hypothetical protein